MRRRSAATVAILAAAALGGCAQGLPLGPAVTVAGGDYQAQGEADLVVRTFVATPDGERREIGGAACEMRSILFATSFTTPARVVVPSFGPQSVTLTVACRAGDLAGAVQTGATTRWVRPPGAWGWSGYGGGYPGDRFGGWGPGWGGAGWSGPAYAVFDYPNLAVSLRPAGVDSPAALGQ